MFWLDAFGLEPFMFDVELEGLKKESWRLMSSSISSGLPSPPFVRAQHRLAKLSSAWRGKT
ncbi:hypothetical protein CMI37_07995 [Candidatus Pacearchaeota archaeon]|nr:hypothetical protein [Candidatus Pacearchaeota archaeon]